MKISIIGAGYVGLVTAACLAKLGNRVVVLDRDEARIAGLRRGELPIHEPGLDELVSAAADAGRLVFETEPSASHATDLTIVAVGTLDNDGEWTGDIVRKAVLDLAADASAPRHIVVRSTLVPGTAVSLRAQAIALDDRIELAHNPEFTRESSAVSDFLTPDRIVLGVYDSSTISLLRTMLVELYEPLTAPIQVTDLTSAEMIKVGSNVFLGAKIAYANELARLCAVMGADVREVVDGIGMDRRIGRQFLSPGPGIGGSCLPSQSRMLPRVAEARGVSTPVMAGIAASNQEHAEWLAERAGGAVGRAPAESQIAVLGMTFKAGTDDLRESPALRLTTLLGRSGARLTVYDPVAGDSAARRLASEGIAVVAAPDALAACSGADLVVVATEWPEFRDLDWKSIAAAMRGDLVLDTRQVVDIPAANAAGLRVSLLGAASAEPQAAALA